MMYPLVRELAEDGIPVTVTCRVLRFTPQAYYKWRASPVSDREWSDAHLVDAAREIHADDPVFGYRFIADEQHAGTIRARRPAPVGRPLSRDSRVGGSRPFPTRTAAAGRGSEEGPIHPPRNPEREGRDGRSASEGSGCA